MDLNNILSQLETANEEEIDALLQQYNREVSRGSARFHVKPIQTALLTLAR